MPPTDPSPIPEDVYLSVAATVDPVDPDKLAAWWSFRMTVDAAWAAGRTAAADAIRAEIVDEPTHENLRMMNAAFALAARIAENGADQ